MGRIMNWIRSVTQRMFGQQNFYKKAGVPLNAITTDMASAIDLWCNLYENNAPWLNPDSKSLALPSRIAAIFARMVTVEMEMKISTGDGKTTDKPGKRVSQPSTRAAFLQEITKTVIADIQKQTEYACAKGGLVFKPYPDGEGISFDFVQADDFYPCAWDNKGNITSAVFLSKKKEGDSWYTRIEKHEWDRPNKKYVITNNCFRSMSEKDSDIGTPCLLSDVPEWAEIEPEVTMDNIEQPLFSYFRIPLGNTIDPKSPLGVSVYATAAQAGLIRDADERYGSLMWEYDGGELAIDASRDAFKTVKGAPELPKGRERLYRMNTIDGTTTDNELLKTFAPTLRDESFIRGLQQTLKQIEDTCGLSRGQLSEVQIETRTAEEIRASKQTTYVTVSNIQTALEHALEGLVKASDTLASLYNLAPEGEYSIKFVWDDSIVVDSDTEKQRDLEEVAAGIMQPWEYRVKWYGEDEQTAKQNVVQDNDSIMGFGLPKKQPISPEKARNNAQNQEKGGENNE